MVLWLSLARKPAVFPTGCVCELMAAACKGVFPVSQDVFVFFTPHPVYSSWQPQEQIGFVSVSQSGETEVQKT